MKYRVNYGNGQVSGYFTSFTKARLELISVRNFNQGSLFGWIDFKDGETGDWFRKTGTQGAL